MAQFFYKHKGTNNSSWNADTIEAESDQDAITKLDGIYGIRRDESGQQLNPELLQIELIGQEEYAQIGEIKKAEQETAAQAHEDEASRIAADQALLPPENPNISVI